MKAILRIEKMKKSSTGGAGAHIHRLKDTQNADPFKRGLNTVFLGSENLTADIEKRLEVLGGKTIRKDAVVGVGVLLTASPEFFTTASDDKQKLWLKNSLSFLKERYGENLVSAVIHRDEKTPHIHAVVVPIKGGKLNCKSVFGEREELSQLQTDYAQAVKTCGLERGVMKSKAKHQDVKTYYSLLNEAIKQEPKESIDIPRSVLPEKNFLGFSSAEQIATAIKTNRQRIYKAFKPLINQAQAEKVIALALKQEKVKTLSLEKQVLTLGIELDGFKEKARCFDALPTETQKQAIDLANNQRFSSFKKSKGVNR